MAKITLPITEDQIDNVAIHLGLVTASSRVYLRYALQGAVLFDKKQQDYGPQNISKFSTFGVVVRMTDKLERIAHLFNKGKRRRARNESIRDSFQDIGVYANIALMCEDNVWDHTEQPVEQMAPPQKT